MYRLLPPRNPKCFISSGSRRFALADPGRVPRRSVFRAGGFTLVEVALALGIVAMAFIPVLGLLPVGLSASRQAMDTTLEAQIAQKMSGLAVQADFSNLESLSSSTRYYFDDQGNDATADRAIYGVGMEVATKTQLPTSNPQGSTTDRLATVTIHILNIADQGPEALLDPLSSPRSSKYVILVADNGR